MSPKVKILIALVLATCTFVEAEVEKPSLEDKPASTNTTVTEQQELENNESFPSLAQADSPICSIQFRPESNFTYFTVNEVQPGVFVVPFEAGEPAEPYQGRDKYLAEIFRPAGRVPPYVRIECLSAYVAKFRFEGVSALQFLRIWQRRLELNVRDGAGESTRTLYRLGVEVLLAPNATGEYIVYPAEDYVPTEVVDSSDPVEFAQSRNDRRTSYYIFAEGPSPYLLGRGRVVNGFANDTTVIVPCISAKYDQYVKLLWRNNKTGTYQYTADSNNNIHGITYVRNIGFIVSRRELRQSTKYPLVPGEYRCMTDSSADVVDVLVAPSPPERGDILRIEVSRHGAYSKALCTGPQGSSVRLSMFSANHLEGLALAKCVADIGSPCGSAFHYPLEGYDLGRISVLTGLPNSGSLVCASDTGDAAHVFYFTGLDGKIYTQPWREIPVSAQLGVRIRRYDGKSDDEPFRGGTTAHILCPVVGDINNPRSAYATFANGTRARLGLVDGSDGYLSVVLHSAWKEITCDAGPWDYSGSIYATRAVNIIRDDCPNDGDIQCPNEECQSKTYACARGLKYLCGVQNFTCFDVYPNGCPTSSDGSARWQCTGNGRCVRENYRCDGDDDCRDGSDEDSAKCQQDFSPRIAEGQREFTGPKGQEFDLVCKVTFRRGKDEPYFEWYAGQANLSLKAPEVAVAKLVPRAEKGNDRNENEGFAAISVLRLENVIDSNTYTCIAKNRFGSATAYYQVEVYDPAPPTTTTDEAPPRPEHPASHRFRCESEGKHPDPRDCRRFHECVPTSNDHFMHYEFSCGEGTVYCVDSQTCGYEYNCPCLDGRRHCSYN